LHVIDNHQIDGAALRASSFIELSTAHRSNLWHAGRRVEKAAFCAVLRTPNKTPQVS
jgi:hypothetical protein